MTRNNLDTIQELLVLLYGDRTGKDSFRRLEAMLREFKREFPALGEESTTLFDVQDVILITYGDLLQESDQPPLKTLHTFHQKYLSDIINTIHILPFFPYSSDDGFSVIDYKEVNTSLGDWDDIARFTSSGVNLMFDAVINHISAKSKWFQKYLEGNPKYKGYFIEVDPKEDLSLVTRPRALPLLTAFETSSGTRHVWTTFSVDQVDLNYQNPDTLLDVLDVLLYYVSKGADLIRLDAIAFLWKEIGTTCIHLPQTHAVVQLMRAVVNEVAPGVLLITETNVPHEENLSYFGDGCNEAHMVYQFSLPPLTAHAIISGSAVYLSEWAAGLKPRNEMTTFMNFTASHDGIGLRPALGILPAKDIELLAKQTLAHGGKISSKTNPDGSESPYELNITYFDLLNNPNSDEPVAVQVQRFLVSQAILLAMVGIPGIYFHSLLGSRNFLSGVEDTGMPRTINREKLAVDEVISQLEDDESLRYTVFSGYQNLLKQRTKHKAFHPNGTQKVLNLNEGVFCLLRTSPDGEEIVLALQNVTENQQTIILEPERWGSGQNGKFVDLLSGNYHFGKMPLPFVLKPYQIAWLKLVPEK